MTIEVLVGILKHETLYDKISATSVVGDREFAKKLRERACSLEAQVVDKADSLAYLNHDVDDGLTSGCIAVDDLKDSALWCRAVEEIKRHKLSIADPIFKYQVVRALIDMQVKDLLDATSARLEGCERLSLEDLVKKSGKGIVDFSDKMIREREVLQVILFDKVYHHWRVERMTSKARRILNELFDVYLDNPKQLPYDVYDRSRSYSEKEKHMIVCNYIAAMTDRAALDEYKRLFEPYKKV